MRFGRYNQRVTPAGSVKMAVKSFGFPQGTGTKKGEMEEEGAAGNGGVAGCALGRKISAQLSFWACYFFICLRMVSASRPKGFRVLSLAICREYQTAPIPGLSRCKVRYAFCQAAYIA